MTDVDGELCLDQKWNWPKKLKFGLGVSSLSAADDVQLRWRTRKPPQSKEYEMQVKHYIRILMWPTYGRTFDHDSSTSGIDGVAGGGSPVL